MHAQIAHLRVEADKAMKNPMLAVVKIPMLLSEVFSLLVAIVNALPEED